MEKVIPFPLSSVRPPSRFIKWTARQRKNFSVLAPEYWAHQCPVIGRTALHKQNLSVCPYCGATEDNETHNFSKEISNA